MLAAWRGGNALKATADRNGRWMRTQTALRLRVCFIGTIENGDNKSRYILKTRFGKKLAKFSRFST